MHALIIEDEYLTAQLIEDRLRDLGFTSFAFAMDEEEAIAAAYDRCPDLITSDVQLSCGCGIDAVQRICDEKPIPVLYITGTAIMVRERCPWAVVIQKPFGMADLREGVQQARRLRSASAQVSAFDPKRTFQAASDAQSLPNENGPKVTPWRFLPFLKQGYAIDCVQLRRGKGLFGSEIRRTLCAIPDGYFVALRHSALCEPRRLGT